jgi:hypothetical protein
MKNRIQVYLRSLEWQLWLRGLSDRDTLAEIESHLLESVDQGLRQGLSREEAELAALKRFGSTRLVSSTFIGERMHLMQKVLLGIAFLSGLFITYVDSRPTWDDTGITAGAILLVCGLIALIGYQRPWLLALAVGAWIPLYGILASHNFGAIIALLIAFIGSYAGWVANIVIRKTFNTA